MLDLIDRLMIRFEDLHRELESIHDELHQLRAVVQEASSNEPAQPAEPPESGWFGSQQPSIHDDPLQETIEPPSATQSAPLPARSAAPYAAGSQPRSPWNEPSRLASEKEDDLATLLERSAWDDGTLTPQPSAEAPSYDTEQGYPQATAYERDPPFGSTQLSADARDIPYPAEDFAVIDDNPPVVAHNPQSAPLLARPLAETKPPTRLPPPTRRPSHRDRTRPPGTWSPTAERDPKPRSSKRQEPQEDLAALLERSDWSEEPPEQAPRSSGRRGSGKFDERDRFTSGEGIEALLSGYLNEKKK